MLKQVHCVHNYNSVNHNIVDSINGDKDRGRFRHIGIRVFGQ